MKDTQKPAKKKNLFVNQSVVEDVAKDTAKDQTTVSVISDIQESTVHKVRKQNSNESSFLAKRLISRMSLWYVG